MSTYYVSGLGTESGNKTPALLEVNSNWEQRQQQTDPQVVMSTMKEIHNNLGKGGESDQSKCLNGGGQRTLL